jgi:hypothetical protein
MTDFSGLPDQPEEAGGDLLSGLPDTNASALRQQYRNTTTPPDGVVKILDLTKKSGLPRVTVEKNMPIAEQRASEPDWNALETTAPVTAQTLAANSKMFEIAHDDTENLGGAEKVLGGLSRQVKGLAGSLSAGVFNDPNAAVWGWAEDAARLTGAEGVGNYFKQMRQFQEAQATGAQGDYGTKGFVESSVASGVRSLGAMIPGLLASVMTGNPQYSLGMGSMRAGGQAVAKGLDAGASPLKALAYGAEDATAEYATEMIPVGLLLKDLKLGAPLYKLLARQIATEVPTEMVATAWQNFNEWLNINPEQSFSDYLTKLGPDEALTVGSTIVQTVLTAGLAHGTNKIVQNLANQQTRAQGATMSAESLDQLAQLAAGSKLRGRDVQTFQEFIDRANEEGDVQEVFIDKNTLAQSGIDLNVLAQLSPVVAEQLAEQNHGGDIVIPVSEYAAKIAGGEFDSVLAPHLRTSEDALSSFEAQTFYQNQAEEFKKASEQIMEERATDDAWTTSAKAVETQLFDQLKQTGRFTDDVNKVNSTLMRDFYVTTASRMGLTPGELFAKYPLWISGESQAGAKTMEQDIQTPAFKNWFGESKVVDATGKPLVVYHGTAKKFTKFSFKDAGQKIIWFTSDKSAIDKGEVGAQGQGVTMDLYASIKNPAGWAEYDKLGLDELQARGYDGVILPESDGTFSGFVFDGKQLKSASRNKGTFDPKNPSILAQAANKVKQVLGLQQEQPQKGGLAMGQFFNQPAYHGSPHKFDKFTMSHIGSGEGAQAYGWGLYFAGDKEVAEFYRNKLAEGTVPLVDALAPEIGKNISEEAYSFLRGYEDINAAIKGLRETANNTPEFVKNAWAGREQELTALNDRYRQAADWIEGNKESIELQRNEGQLYEVSIPDDGEYLLWDKPLSEQPEKVRAALEGAGLVATEEQRAEMLRVKDRAFSDFDAGRITKEQRNGILDGLKSTTLATETGSALYERLTKGGDEIDRQEAASKYLHSLGIQGIKYLDGTSRSKGDGSFNYVIFDENAIEILNKYYQAQGNRGEITLADDITQSPTVLTLLKNADLSSFLHEMGHFQLEVMAHIASQPNAPAEIVNDLNAVLGWFGVADLPAWQAMSLEEKRPFHEQFARGFEAYLFEGKAPSVELRAVFARVRAWLLNVYKSMAALKVEINDDIRRVFDRLLATDEAIKQAESMRSYGALFTSAEQMGVDAEGWAEYQRTGQEATDSAVDDLQRKSMRDMQWLTNARNRTLKKLQKEAKVKRSLVQDEVTTEVQAMPVYAAQRFLRYGIGNDITKLSLPELKEMYGEGPAAPWRYLSVGQYGLAATEGLPPDRVAEMFGFTSGDHLVREVLAAAPEAEMIEGMTDQRVLERYGDISSPDALNRAADEAIHNAARTKFIATGLKALDKSKAPVRVIAQAAKAFAEATLARKKVREIKPNQFAAAEARASKSVQKAMMTGDTRAAAVEQRNMLVQNQLTRSAYNALEEIDKAVRYLRKFDKEGTRKNLDRGYIEQIDQLLERFDLRASTPLKAAAKRESLLAWVESQREQGFEPDIPPDLLSEALRKPYRELTLEELRGLIDTVKQIEHLGRLKHKLLTTQDAREFAAIRDEIAASIEQYATKTVDLRTRANAGGMLKEAGNRFLAIHRKMASMARELDGFKDGGPVWEYFIRSMNTAGDHETSMRADATARLYELVKTFLPAGKMHGKGRFFASLGDSFNREERIAIALNLGNAGNMQRLLDGEGWTLDQLRPLLDTITPEEADFVQEIWNFFETYRPEIAAKELRIYGKEPVWVEPVPVTLGGKELKGGYYPIRYDSRRSGKAEQHADAEEARQQMKGAYTTATTRRSFTKTRAAEVTGRPLLYSFSGLYLGTNEVIHDLAWHEWLIDANRLLRSLDGPIRTPLRR